MKPQKFRVSRDTPALFITAVTKDGLPVFRTEAVKIITCGAIDKARKACEFTLLAYVLMPEHVHLLTDNSRSPSEILRHLKGTIAHDVLEYLKEHGYQESLRKLRHEEWKRRHRYSFWEHEFNVFSIFSENVLMQKVNYVHHNPVREGVAQKATDYLCSNARAWAKCASDSEPLALDIGCIEWRKPAVGA
jgi:REP-associated tyrosine transposase